MTNRRASQGLRCIGHRALAVALLAAALNAVAADAPPLAAGADVTSLSTELVKPGLYRISGAAGGTLLRLSTSGLIVVDSKRPGSYRPLMTEIQRIGKAADLPVSALILTAPSPEHAGNFTPFVDAGVPVIVQRRALARLVGTARTTGATASPWLIVYDDDYMLRAGNVEVQVEHVGSGRTGVDSVVHFRDLRVLAVGELFTSGKPEPDCASGGSFAGWAAAIAHLLWLDFDVAIPSRGAPVGKPELQALQATLEALAERGDTSPSGPSDCRSPR